MSRGRTLHPPYAVIDPGAEKEVIGGVGWHIIHFSDRSEALSGALTGMGSKVFHWLTLSQQWKIQKEE